MVDIEILVNTNASNDEKEKLKLSQEAIEEFLETGFCSNEYNGSVIFSCMPRAVDPGLIDIIIDMGAVAESIIAWTTIIGAILKFIKRSKGYEFCVTLKKKRGTKEVEFTIEMNDKSNDEDIISQIMEKIK